MEGVDLGKHPSGIIPHVSNIVATANLHCRPDLKLMSLKARNCEYNPKRFSGAIMRIKEPKSTSLIFKTGKLVCTGTKSEKESVLAARKHARIVQKMGFQAHFKDYKIQNVVGSCDVKFSISLEKLEFDTSDPSSHILYEPELFPGLFVKCQQHKTTALVFQSGKLIITGCKNRDHLYASFEKLYPLLQKHRKA